MRRLVVNVLALAAVLADIGIGLGQQQPRKKVREEEASPAAKAEKAAPEKSKLEEMLAESLKNSPDIRVAAAKVAEAEAELNRTRVQVTQKVVALYYAIETQKKVVAHEEGKLKRSQAFLKARSIDSDRDTHEEAAQAFALAKAKLAELEAQMPALLGKVARAGEQDPVSAILIRNIMASAMDDQQLLRRVTLDLTGSLPRPDQIRATGPLADKIRKALETPIQADYKHIAISEFLKDLQKKAPDLSFHIRDLPRFDVSTPGGAIKNEEEKVKLHFDMPLPIAALLQAVEDEVAVHFIVRDYGILVTSGKLPPGALTVQEFMRQKPAEK